MKNCTNDTRVFVKREEVQSHGAGVFDNEATGVEQLAIVVESDTDVVIVVVGWHDGDGSGQVEIWLPDLVRKLPAHRDATHVA